MRIIAHRGYSGIAPENTIAAFDRAIEAGCKTIEFDVQLTLDGVPFVIHDPTIDRTTNGRGRVIEIDSSELAIYSAGYEDRFGSAFIDERIQSLEEVLKHLKGKAQVLIEIKSESVFDEREDIEREVVAALSRERMIEQAVVISFDARALRRVKAIDSSVAIGFLSGRDSSIAIGTAKELGASLVLFHTSQINREKVDEAHRSGMQCAIYNVDRPEELPPFLSLGLDGIGSNFPGDLIKALQGGG